MSTIFDQIQEHQVDVRRCVMSSDKLQFPEYLSIDEPWDWYQKIAEDGFMNLIVFIVTLKRQETIKASEEDFAIVRKITEMLNNILENSRIRYSNINVSSFYEYVVNDKKYDLHYGKVGVQYEQRVKTTLQLSHRIPSNYMFYFKFGVDFSDSRIFSILNFMGRIERFCYYCDKLNPGMSRTIIEMYHRPKFNSIFPYKCESRNSPTVGFRFNSHNSYPKQLFDAVNIKNYGDYIPVVTKI